MARPLRHSPRSRVNPGRGAAIQALCVIDEGQHAEEALATLAPADPGDRALSWSLVLGVLRHRSALDEVMSTVAKRSPRTLDPVVRAAVRVGLYELRHARVPPHAAVDQAVEAVRALGVAHAAGFVNAVLRRSGEVTVSPDAATGHPPWIVERWRARYGREAADAWMEANNLPAPVYIVAREDPAGVAREFQHRGIGLLPGPGDGVFRLAGPAGPIPSLPGYLEGRWWVMDPAAVAVADLAGELPSGTEVLDTCAAPGGKSFRLAARGARVTATDSEPRRLERIVEVATRLGLPVAAAIFDWSTGSLDRRFPLVVVDAPCTGLGTLRRHPDIRWNRREDDIPRMAEKQKVILANAARCVAPGGALLYAVCSPEPEEGVEVAATLGWVEEDRYTNAPALGGEDVFWAVRLRAPPG